VAGLQTRVLAAFFAVGEGLAPPAEYSVLAFLRAMPNCPICRHQLQKPPEDVRDWFRCENCGTPLQVPPLFGRVLLWASTLLLAALIWVLAYVGMRYLGMVFPGFELHLPMAVMTGIVLGSYGWLVRRFWKTKLVNPRPCDPYSTLNLSDQQTKMRGRWL
jgi:hypothetical protein